MTNTLGQIKTKHIKWHTFVENAIKRGADVDWWEDKRPLEDVEYVSIDGAIFYSDGDVTISLKNCKPTKMQKLMEALDDKDTN